MMPDDLIRSNIPVPDPSLLTTEMLRREISSLRELLDTRISAVEKSSQVFQENLLRVPTDTTKQMLQLKEFHDEKIAAIIEYRRAMLVSIEKQFETRDLRLEEVKSSFHMQMNDRDIRSTASDDAARTAVAVGLAAAKENVANQNAYTAASIAKSEAASTKQVDAIVALLASNNAAIADKIAGLTARLDRGDGQTQTSSVDRASLLSVNAEISDKIATLSSRLDRGDGSRSGQNTSQATMLAVGAVVISVIVGGFAIFSETRSPSTTALQPTLPYTFQPQGPPTSIAPTR